MILAIAHYGAPKDISGVTTWLGGLVKEAHARGHTIDLLIHDLGRNPHEGSFLSETSSFSRIITAKTKPTWTENGVRQTIDFLNASRPGVFFPQCLESFHFAGRYAEQFGIPWVFTVHSDDPVYWGLLEECAPQSQYGKVVVVSDYLNEEVRRRGLAKNPITIPCGVTKPTGQAKYSHKPFRVVYSGRVIEEQKRASLILKAMIIACNANPTIECVIIGDGPGRTAAEQQVREHGLSERIHFTGALSHTEVLARIADCQAFLLMSDYEGLPVALLEAMATGLVPVVRSMRSGIAQVMKHRETGLLVGDDPAEAAQALILLSNDPELWARLSSQAKRLVLRDYEAQACFQKWFNLLDELASSGSPHYPIPNPARIILPKINPKLAGRDLRRPTGFAWLPALSRSIRRRIVKTLSKVSGKQSK